MDLQLVSRFVWSIDEYEGYYGEEADQICVDRLTGQEVVRYDLGDPANYAASHGGWSKDEYLLNKGLIPDEEIDISQSVVEVSPAEVKWHAERKAGQAQREKEEAEAIDLLDFLPDLPTDAASGFCENDGRKGKTWQDWEEDIARPALEAAGFTSVSFYMMEEDSFGPLMRGVRVEDVDGNVRRLFYG